LDLVEDAVKLCFHDGTERPIQRPTDPAVQETFYSGNVKAKTRQEDRRWGRRYPTRGQSALPRYRLSRLCTRRNADLSTQEAAPAAV